jgi:hypothetical protein
MIQAPGLKGDLFKGETIYRSVNMMNYKKCFFSFFVIFIFIFTFLDLKTFFFVYKKKR